MEGEEERYRDQHDAEENHKHVVRRLLVEAGVFQPRTVDPVHVQTNCEIVGKRADIEKGGDQTPPLGSIQKPQQRTSPLSKHSRLLKKKSCDHSVFTMR